MDDFKYHGRKYIRPIFALICRIMTFFQCHNEIVICCKLFHLENIERGYERVNIRFRKFGMKIWMFFLSTIQHLAKTISICLTMQQYQRASSWSHVHNSRLRAFWSTWKPFYKPDLYFAEQINFALFIFLGGGGFRVSSFNLLTITTFSLSLW